MALSPDGRMLASSSWDKTVRIWDINSGKLLLTLKGHEDPICVAWSPDNQVIASGDYKDGTIRLWNLESGELLRILKGHTGAILSITWSPGRNILASGSDDNTIRFWNADTGKTLKILTEQSSVVDCVAWSPDGRTLCSGSRDNTVRLWNAKTGKQRYILGFNPVLFRDERKCRNEKIADNEILDGICAFISNHIESSDTHFLFSGEKIIKAYRDKAKIEDAFKHIKSFLNIRSFYVNLDEHVRAVYSICVPAYFLNKDLAERRKKIDGVDYLNSKNLYEPFRSCHYVTLKDKPSGGKKSKTVELTLEQESLLRQLQIKIK